MKKYYYINATLLLIVAIATLSGPGHATLQGIIFSLSLWIYPVIGTIMALIIFIRYRKLAGVYPLLLLTALTAAFPWIMLGALMW